jgi:tetratricopeptide (TPR) repeat protein
MNSDELLRRTITVAQGYVELGLPLDANEELEQIEPDQCVHPEVLAIRVKIYRVLKKWELMQTVAQILAVNEPEHVQWTVDWAYATRRADCLNAARLILVNAVESQPNVAIFHYNLACYECQLGNLEGAKSRLKRAFELEPRYRLKALEDGGV